MVMFKELAALKQENRALRKEVRKLTAVVAALKSDEPEVQEVVEVPAPDLVIDVMPMAPKEPPQKRRLFGRKK